MTDSHFLTAETFKAGISKLESAFRQMPLSEVSLAIYYEKLSHITDHNFKQAVENIIDTDNFFPSISTMLERSGGRKFIDTPPTTQKSLQEMIS